MRLNAVEFIVLLAIIICSALLVTSCSHSPPLPTDPLQCCKRLETGSVALKRFERMCIALAFLEDRFRNDARATKNIKEGLTTCKYVFDIKKEKIQ